MTVGVGKMRTLTLSITAAVSLVGRRIRGFGWPISPRPPPRIVPPPAPIFVYNWTGFYVGGNLGGAWASGTLTDSFTGASLSDSKSGFIGGGQVGFNYQITNFVIGAEWDFDGTSLNASRTGGFVTASANTNWVTTVAARFGVAAGSWLFYGKAGGGWVNNHATVTNNLTGASLSASNTNSGWLAGRRHRIRLRPQLVRQARIRLPRPQHLELQFDGVCAGRRQPQCEPEHSDAEGRLELSIWPLLVSRVGSIDLMEPFRP